MLRKKYNLKKSSYNSWDDVLSHPAPIELVSFITGQVKIPLRGTINPHHIKAGHISDKILTVPIIFHVLRHKYKGDFLIDTGLDSKYRDDSKGVDGVLVRKIAEEYTLNNNGTLFQLEHNQIKPKLIFVSHLHPDHVAGVRELTNIPVVISYNERFTEDKFIILSQYFKDLNELYEIDFSKGNDLEIFGQCADVLGDGSLWAIPTPGHTRGHLSFLVNSTEPVLLTADACFINENLERGIAPSIYAWNKMEAQRSLDRIIRFKNQYPQIRVGAGHEALK